MTMMVSRNTGDVGHGITAGSSAWRFGGDVVPQFDNHVRQSVPFYDVGHDLVGKLSDFFIGDHSVCYDLGCSTGELVRQLAGRHAHRLGTQFIGIDSEADMVTHANQQSAPESVQFVVDDICTTQYQHADLIIAYYTVQFVRPRQRQDLINRLYTALNWGGALILFEKVRGADARFQDIFTTLYTEFKQDQLFTADEILAKSRSLKGVLEPFSTQGNLDMLRRAGFLDIVTVMKYLCFEGFLAIK